MQNAKCKKNLTRRRNYKQGVGVNSETQLITNYVDFSRRRRAWRFLPASLYKWIELKKRKETKS